MNVEKLRQIMTHPVNEIIREMLHYVVIIVLAWHAITQVGQQIRQLRQDVFDRIDQMAEKIEAFGTGQGEKIDKITDRAIDWLEKDSEK